MWHEQELSLGSYPEQFGDVYSWDFIYAEYVIAAGHQYRSIIWQVRSAQIDKNVISVLYRDQENAECN